MKFNSSNLFHILKNSSYKFETCHKACLKKKCTTTEKYAVTVSGTVSGTAAAANGNAALVTSALLWERWVMLP